MIKSVLRGFSYLVFLKLFSKVVDFSLNIMVIRKIDKSIFGLTMHHGLFLSFALLLAKNCLRQSYLKRTILSSGYKTQNEYDNIVIISSQNLMRLGFYATILLAPTISLLWNHLYGHLHPYFSTVTWFFCAGSLLESAMEIIICRSMLSFNYRVVAVSEGISISIKTIVLFGLINFKIVDPLHAYGIAQLTASIALLISAYTMCSKNDNLSISQYFKPSTITNDTTVKEPYKIHPEMLTTSKKFTFIQIFKFLLTEVEKIILMNTGVDVGSSAEYTLVSNLGSMIPRYIYAPTEEICFNFFGKLSQDTKEEDVKEVKKNEFEIVKNVFRIIHLIGLTLVVFGWNYSYAGLTILYGDKWSSETCVMALKTYMIYVYTMGLNGITEAYLYSTIKGKEMDTYRYLIAVNTAIYIGLCLFLINYGAVGIIVANTLSMTLRIIIALVFISGRKGTAWSVKDLFVDSLPHKISLLYFVIALVAGNVITNMFPHKLLIHIGSGAVLMLGNVASIYIFYRHQIMDVLRQRHANKEKAN